MSVIYRPTGMAREYSPYALNLYIGCSHRCKYCYAPHTLQKSEKAYFGTPEPRKNILALLESDLKKTAYTEQILLSFVGDVYCESADGGETTREALSLLNAYHAPVAVLSKGGKRMLRDLDLFRAFGERIAVGTTLTFLDQEKSREWEPYASTPEERLGLAREFLETHSYLTVSDYAALTGLLRNAAAKELRRWAEDETSGIGRSGRGTHRVYVRRVVPAE